MRTRIGRSSARRVRGSGKGLIDRRARLREELRTRLGDVQTVLEPNSEFAVDGDHRLVAEAHARGDWRLVAAHEVGPFVAVEADAVAGAVRQPGHFVARPETGVRDHLPRRGV